MCLQNASLGKSPSYLASEDKATCAREWVQQQNWKIYNKIEKFIKHRTISITLLLKLWHNIKPVCEGILAVHEK